MQNILGRIWQARWTMFLPHTLSVFQTNYIRHFGIWLASYQFPFVLHYQEMPMVESKAMEFSSLMNTFWNCIPVTAKHYISERTFAKNALNKSYQEIKRMIALTTPILSIDIASSNIPSARQASQGMGPELMKRKDFNSKDFNFNSAAYKTE